MGGFPGEYGVRNLSGFRDVFGYSVRQVDRSTIQLPPALITGVLPRIISFPDEFVGHAIDVIIDNRDGLNNLLYRVNTNIGAQKTVGPSETATISDSVVLLLDIAGPSTAWEVQAQIVPRL